MIPVITFCTEPYYWLLAPFAALFRKYYGNDKIICYGDRKWPDELPGNVDFRPVPIIGRDYWNWTEDFGNGVAAILGNINEPIVLITLPDMWPKDHVCLEMVKLVEQYLKEKSNTVVRALLGNDENLSCNDSLVYETWRDDLKLFSVRPTHPNLGHHGGFLLSPSLWNRELTISLLQNDNFLDWELTHRRKLIQRPGLHCVWTHKNIYPFGHVCFRQDPMQVKLFAGCGFQDEDKELAKSLLPEWVTVVED